ncbi:MAG: PAS domain-containing protein [Pirellulales bacterium]|nr:PAS domain-containing protein [Pirellulales bacterium]
MRKKRLLWVIYPYYLVIALASLAAITWYDCAALQVFYKDRTREELLARAMLLEKRFLIELAAGNSERIDALCKELGKKGAMRITVVLPDGTVAGDSDESPKQMDNHADRPEIIAALANSSGNTERYSHTLHEARCYVAIPLHEGSKILGVLRTSVSVKSIESALNTIRFRIIAICAAMALMVAATSWWFLRRITRPLEVLRTGAERLAEGDLTYKLSVGDIQEFGALAESLNRMAAALDEKIRDLVSQGNERESILSSMAEGVLAVDAEERLLRVNEAAAKLLGIDAEQAAGRTLQEVVRNRELQRLVASVLSSHRPREDEIVLRGERGERYLQAQGTVLRDARQIRGALVILHEVTQLKKLEKVRRDFVANVSHELRTPVTSIKGFVETLLDGAMHNPEELPRFLQIVAVQTDRLNAIIEDLLTLSRIEQEEEKAEIALGQAAVRSVLETAVEVCRMKAAEKNVRLEMTCDAELTAAVNAPLLEQAVINLIDNAIKYSSPEQAVLVTAEPGDGEIAIRVRDRGCGIGREHLPRIFERFYRVDKARSRKLGGTGLGLAIVKHIAQAHGGRATVESTPGQGSTFTIHLPHPHPSLRSPKN